MNLLNGFTGLFSLGQAGFMLLGAYTYAIIMVPEASRESVYRMFSGEHWVKFSLADIFGTTGAGSVVGMLIALILGGLVAALFAWLIGLPVLRLKSDYLAIATLGFAEIIRAIFQWDKLGPLTNGANVSGRVPVLQLGTVAYYLVAGVCIALIVLLINSTYGRAFKAIRDDEVAAEAMGVNLSRHKMTVLRGQLLLRRHRRRPAGHVPVHTHQAIHVQVRHDLRDSAHRCHRRHRFHHWQPSSAQLPVHRLHRVVAAFPGQ